MMHESGRLMICCPGEWNNYLSHALIHSQQSTDTSAGTAPPARAPGPGYSEMSAVYIKKEMLVQK